MSRFFSNITLVVCALLCLAFSGCQSTKEQYGNVIAGKYVAENDSGINLSVAYKDGEYYLTYIADDITLSDIPAYSVEEDLYGTDILFITDDFYPEYRGCVSFGYSPKSTVVYSCSAELDGITDLDGDYFPLVKE